MQQQTEDRDRSRSPIDGVTKERTTSISRKECGINDKEEMEPHRAKILILRQYHRK